MKRQYRLLTLIVASFLAVIIPLGTYASIYSETESYTLAADETAEGNVYAAGNSLSVNGTVTGDFVGAGGTATLNGTFEDDILLAGGTTTFSGTAKDDMRIVGGTLVISGTVEGDVNVAAGTVTIEESARINGDVMIGSGMAYIKGHVGQNVGIASGEIEITGTVNGNVVAYVDKLTIDDNASITGSLTYTSVNPARISSNATIGGGITFNQQQKEYFAASFGLFGLGVVGFLFNLIGMFVLALVAVLIFQKFSESVIKETTSNFWKPFVYGIIVLIVTPILSGILMVTIIGIPIAFFLFIAYAFLICLGGLYANIFAGSLLMRWIQRKQDVALDWKVALVGSIVMAVVVLIPVMGWFAAFILFLTGLGSVSLALYQLLGKK